MDIAEQVDSRGSQEQVVTLARVVGRAIRV